MAANEDQDRPVWLDPRVWFVLALLGGTGIGGAGRGLIDDGTEKALADLGTQVALLRAEVKGATLSASMERGRLERSVSDHEQRIRELEAKHRR